MLGISFIRHLTYFRMPHFSAGIEWILAWCWLNCSRQGACWGSKLESAFRKQRGWIRFESNRTVLLLPTGMTACRLLSKREVAEAHADNMTAATTIHQPIRARWWRGRSQSATAEVSLDRHANERNVKLHTIHRTASAIKNKMNRLARKGIVHYLLFNSSDGEDELPKQCLTDSAENQYKSASMNWDKNKASISAVVTLSQLWIAISKQLIMIVPSSLPQIS